MTFENVCFQKHIWVFVLRHFYFVFWSICSLVSLKTSHNPFQVSYNLIYNGFICDRLFLGFVTTVTRFHKIFEIFYIFVLLKGFLVSFYVIRLMAGPICKFVQFNFFNGLRDKFMVLTAFLPFSRKNELKFLILPVFVLFVVVWRALDNDRSQLLPMEIQKNIFMISVSI